MTEEQAEESQDKTSAAPEAETAKVPRPTRASASLIREVAITFGALAAVILAILLVQDWRDRSSQPSLTAAPLFTDMNGNAIDVELGVTTEGKAAIGKPAVDFQLVDPDGNLVSLTDFRGAPVLVNFWATWCVPCRREVPDFVVLQEEWGDSVRIVGVDLQERADTVSQFAKDFQINYSLVLDLDGEVTRAYQLSGLPETFFLDASGIIRDHRIGRVEKEVARCIAAGILAGNHEPEDCR